MSDTCLHHRHATTRYDPHLSCVQLVAPVRSNYQLELEMTSNNRMLLALGVAGLVLFSVVGKSMKMVRDRNQTRKDLTTWEGEGGNPLPAASASTNPQAPPTSH